MRRGSSPRREHPDPRARSRLQHIAMVGLMLMLCSCTASPIWISPGDTVLTACQQPAIENVASLQGTVDRANSTNPGAGWSGDTPEQMTSTDVINLRKAAGSLRAWAAQVDGGHHWFANALRDEAQQYTIAAAAPRGLTVNSVAAATDTYAKQIQAYCGRFRTGHVPAGGKPGPGLWDWGLFWLVAGGYLAAAVISSRVIALGQRSRPRDRRLQPGQIALRSLVWWVFIIGAAWQAWLHSLANATLTKDERQADRIAEQAAEIKRLEQLNKKLSRKDGP